MNTRILPVLLASLLLVACGEEKPADKAPDKAAESGQITTPPTAASTADSTTEKQPDKQADDLMEAQAELPVDAPAIGTPIQTITPKSSDQPEKDGEYTKLEWENLELPGQGLADIMKKYQPQIDAIPEGDPAENAVTEKMQAELNAAPVNPALNGKKIKIPGFISPLEVDEAKGVVKEFLLVPYLEPVSMYPHRHSIKPYWSNQQKEKVSVWSACMNLYGYLAPLSPSKFTLTLRKRATRSRMPLSPSMKKMTPNSDRINALAAPRNAAIPRATAASTAEHPQHLPQSLPAMRSAKLSKLAATQ